jgi:glycosyltransferase involved in cell wall biosynthesis
LFNSSTNKKLIDKLKLGKLLSEGLFKYNEEKRDVLILIDVFWHDNTLIDQIFSLNNQGLRVLTFVHDLFPLTNPEWFEKKSVSQFTRNMDIAISISNGVITSSEMNYHEIEKYIFKKNSHRSQNQLTRINLGIDHLEPRKNHKTNSKKGLIWVGTIEPRKNVKFLIEFIEFYNPTFPIFVIGKIGWRSFDEVSHLRRLNKAKKITWLQNCSDEELMEVISKCEIGLITSINEGYGFVLYEFLNFDLRVIAPNIKVFSEQKLEGVEFYEPNNIQDLAKVCLSENNNRAQLELNKLPSWNNFTKQLWDFASKI